MTIDYAAHCAAAGLTVLSVEAAGRVVTVCVARVPLSAGGLQALAARIGPGGDGAPTLTFVEEA